MQCYVYDNVMKANLNKFIRQQSEHLDIIDIGT